MREKVAGGLSLGKSGSANTINGSTTLNQAATLKSTLDVTGNTTVNGTATLKGNTTVDGTATLKSTLDVAGVTTLGGIVQIANNTDASLSSYALRIGRTGFAGLHLDSNEIEAVTSAGAASNLILQYDGGNVGIGTASPSWPLTVNRGFSSTIDLQAYMDGGGAVNVSGSRDQSLNHSISSSSRIKAGGGFDVESDARIKTVTERVDCSTALRELSRLRVTDYRMKDMIGEGSANHRGFIAQEVEAVLPDAVRKVSRIVPDIMRAARTADFDTTGKTLRVQLNTAHGLAAGDKVRLMTDDGTKERTIVAVPAPDQFVVGDWPTAPKRVFVYGREVSDFRVLDYDLVFSTGIAAIQEVNRKLDASNKQLQSEVATIRGENARLNEQLASVMQRLQSLESRVK